MGKLFVLADEHTQLLIVDADVVFYHIFRDITAHDVVLYEIKHHVGVVHRGFTVAFLCEAIVVIPRLHDFYQLVNGVIEGAGG